jgi:hypothetical protein
MPGRDAHRRFLAFHPLRRGREFTSGVSSSFTESGPQAGGAAPTIAKPHNKATSGCGITILSTFFVRSGRGLASEARLLP